MHDHLEPLANSNELAGVSVHGGFPNPAADNLGNRHGLALDLNQLLIQHPSSSYLFRIHGHHWTEQGIFDGDIAIIDRALRPSAQDIVLSWQDENFELGRYNNVIHKQTVWGVVSATIHPRS